jgi:hypothetical protein
MSATIKLSRVGYTPPVRVGLTSTAGSVTLRGNAAANRLDMLNDVVESSPPNGSTLVYNSTTDKYVVQRLTINSDDIPDVDGGTF